MIIREVSVNPIVGKDTDKFLRIHRWREPRLSPLLIDTGVREFGDIGERPFPAFTNQSTQAGEDCGNVF
jgi:hypothetical protein